MSVGVIAGNAASINIIKATVDLGSVAANTTEEETFSVPGVKVGDFIVVTKGNLEAGLILGSARVEANDVVTVEVCNPTGSAIDDASEVMTLLVVRPEGNAQSLPTALQL